MTVFNWGIAVAAAFVAVVLAGMALFDAWFAFRNEMSLGARINRWAGRYPVYSALIIAFLGALLAHFFLHTGI